MFSWLTENWTLKLISLLLALLLWVFIMGERRVEIGYRVPLEIQNMPEGLMVANEVPSVVDVRVSGPRTLLAKINANDISILVDLTDLQPGLTTFKRLEERLNLPNGLRVTRLSPSFVDLKLERIKQKRVPIEVKLTGEPLEGYRVGRVSATPAQVVVEGAESEIKGVSRVPTEVVDLTGVDAGFSVIVQLDYRGNYTYLKETKTTEVQVDIQALEQPPAKAGSDQGEAE
jgi:YbbR domain-containing protein